MTWWHQWWSEKHRMMAVPLPQHVVWDDPLDGLLIAAITLMGNVVEKYSSERKLKRRRRNVKESLVTCELLLFGIEPR